jgi:hypothetical protein
VKSFGVFGDGVFMVFVTPGVTKEIVIFGRFKVEGFIGIEKFGVTKIGMIFTPV